MVSKNLLDVGLGDSLKLCNNLVWFVVRQIIRHLIDIHLLLDASTLLFMWMTFLSLAMITKVLRDGNNARLSISRLRTWASCDTLWVKVAQSKNDIAISQRKYALEILEETRMLDYGPIDTPMNQTLNFYQIKVSLKSRQILVGN